MVPSLGSRVAVAAALIGALACGRRNNEHADDVAPAAAAPMAEASGAATAPSSATAAAAAVAPMEKSASADALPTLSAQALLGRIRAAGNKGTLVNAWASWCGPCRREIPMLQNLQPNLHASGIDVLLVSLDEPADVEKAKAFLEQNHVTLPSVLAERPLGAFKTGLNPRWPGMLPASFLFDASGTLRYFWGGEAFETELLPVLDAFAAGRPIAGEADFQVGHEAPTP